MKKVLILSISLLCLFMLTGCGKYGKSEIMKDLNKKIKNTKAYYVEGEMEIINNEDTYKYNVKVSYKAKDYYKVSLKNQSNNHEQIILKNDDGVYVLTPSLNKSFKFESEWPYNNSQVYLLQSVVNDINNDKALSFEEKDDRYVFTTSVNYPNNRSLVKQMIYFDKKLNLKEIHVINEKGTAEIKMTYKTIDNSPTFSDDYFALTKNIEASVIDENTKVVTSIDDTIFPMFLPENTKLQAQDTIAKSDGERVILTFSGDKPFVLVEETVSIPKELEIIPTIGEPTLLMDTIGSLSTNSVSWISNGMEYYVASEVMSQDELISVAKSISTIPVMK